MSCRLQHHADDSWSYTADLDPERDARTIAHLPPFLRQFIRFPGDQKGHFFAKLFQALNLTDVDSR